MIIVYKLATIKDDFMCYCVGINLHSNYFNCVKTLSRYNGPCFIANPKVLIITNPNADIL